MVPRECWTKRIRERWINATLSGRRWLLDSGFPNSDRLLPTSSYTLWTSALPGPRSARCASGWSLAAKSLSNAGTLALDAWLFGRLSKGLTTTTLHSQSANLGPVVTIAIWAAIVGPWVQPIPRGRMDDRIR